ncbi:MAG: outer membrane protein assembly factor BamE [Magnetococcales bacterium]|nr:outer membrane protein assembly factor BamE [Magnetococcales bacterium]
MRRCHHPFRISVLLSLLLLLTACQAAMHEKGSILDPDKVDKVKVGVTTRTEVKSLLGHPTFVNSFRDERWLYVHDRAYRDLQYTYSRAFNRVEVTFDDAGVVKDLKKNFDEALLDPTKMPEAQRGDVGWWHRFSEEDPEMVRIREQRRAEREESAGTGPMTNKDRYLFGPNPHLDPPTVRKMREEREALEKAEAERRGDKGVWQRVKDRVLRRRAEQQKELENVSVIDPDSAATPEEEGWWDEMFEGDPTSKKTKSNSAGSEDVELPW